MIGDKEGFIRHITFEDIRAKLPEPRLWDGNMIAPDVLIVAIGFEERAAAISKELGQRLAPESTAVALLGRYDSNADDNACNDGIIREALGKFCQKLRTFSADSPTDILGVVGSAIQDLASGRQRVRVAFDISGSSSTVILSVMAAIASVRHLVDLDILYTEPETYAPSKSEFECNLEGLICGALAEGNDESFVEQGVSDVDANELYAGHSVENRPDRVLAIPSFRTSRLLRCLSYASDQPIVSPQESIYWILGEPPASGLKWRYELQKRIVERQLAVMMGREPGEVTAQALTKSNSVVASTRDYREILKILLNEISLHAGANLSLVHMGSKLQGIGVALALHVRSEVALLHARPKRFNVDKYSKGVSTLWRIEFGDFAGILEELKKVGQIELQTKTDNSRERRPTV